MTNEQYLSLLQSQQAIIEFQAKTFLSLACEHEALKHVLYDMAEKLGLDKKVLDEQFRKRVLQAENRLSEFPVPKLPFLGESDEST